MKISLRVNSDNVHVGTQKHTSAVEIIPQVTALEQIYFSTELICSLPETYLNSSIGSITYSFNQLVILMVKC